MKRFKKYRNYSLCTIDGKGFVLVQIGITSFVLVDVKGNLLNNGIYADKPNYITHKELVKLAQTDKVEFQGNLEYSPVVGVIQHKIFKALRNEDYAELQAEKLKVKLYQDKVTKLKEGLTAAIKELTDLGVTVSQQEVYIKIEKLLK